MNPLFNRLVVVIVMALVVGWLLVTSWEHVPPQLRATTLAVSIVWSVVCATIVSGVGIYMRRKGSYFKVKVLPIGVAISLSLAFRMLTRSMGAHGDVVLAAALAGAMVAAAALLLTEPSPPKARSKVTSLHADRSFDRSPQPA